MGRAEPPGNGTHDGALSCICGPWVLVAGLEETGDEGIAISARKVGVVSACVVLEYVRLWWAS